MTFVARWAVLGLGLLAFAPACGDDEGADGSGGTGNSSSNGGSGANANANETCTATYAILQKDAYKETAGRSSPLWPPHTTTTLTVTCTPDGGAPEEVSNVFQANHGTEPGDVDANGDVFLVEMASTTLSGTREQLLDLVAAYEACSCESSTKFLSLDALQDEAVQELVETLAGYISTNLTCSGMTDTDGLIMLLQQGMIEEVLAVLPNCTWAGGTDLEQGLSQALEDLIAAAGETLAGYHVCNNDALLQAELIEAFATQGQVVACDAATPTCSGPTWFYEP